MPNPGRTTRLLRLMSAGDEQAAGELFGLVYGELRELAGRMMAGERRDHTLQATALVHEAWLKLMGGATVAAEDRGHFVRLASRAMRRVLVDHARSKGREKRGGGRAAVTLDEALVHFERANTDLLALDEALQKLGAQDEELLRIVELRLFGGLTLQETAEHLGLTQRQAHTRWTIARGWLKREMERA